MEKANRQDLVFRVFVSSTFSDFSRERNALQNGPSVDQDGPFQNLREYCRQHGARFQAIDLRWGVSEEAGLDQQTMNICLGELRRCQDLSPRPNFIVLSGDRCGWCPLPPQIDADEFEELLGHVPENSRGVLVGNAPAPPWASSTQIERLGWYRKDENAVPPVYALQPRRLEHMDSASADYKTRAIDDEAADWATMESRMRALLLDAMERAGWTAKDPRRFKYEASATHQEIRAGAFDAESPEEHVFGYIRSVSGMPENANAAEFRDLRNGAPDEDAVKRLDALKQQLGDLLPESSIHKYQATWSDAGPSYDLTDFCHDVESDLRGVIDRELELFTRQPEVEREQSTHHDFGSERIKVFKGRREHLARITRYIDSDERHPLVVHGRSGTGKTALLAKAIEKVASDSVVARFIGATPGSSDLRGLLAGLCREFGVKEIPVEINELVSAFRDSLANDDVTREESGLLVVFLDALDQLNPGEGATSLHWLPRSLRSDVKLVLSVLEPEDDAGDDGTDHPFAIARRIWPDSMLEVAALDEQSGAEALDAWLSDKGRTLREDQRQSVLDAFSACPAPLYLRLLMEEACLWASWDAPPKSIPESIPAVLSLLLERLERGENHGATLVARALGSIAAAKNGLTEDEILDVLSRDDAVLAEFRNRSPKSPPIERLPVAVWSRLRSDVEPYMANRQADGTVVLSYYHAQVASAVAERHLQDDARAEFHLRLAEYFDGLDYWAESIEEQRKRAKRLPPTPRPANIRKVVELPYHRLEAAKLLGKDDAESPHWDAVAELMTDWQFLEAKAEADPNSQEQPSVGPVAQRADEGEA